MPLTDRKRHNTRIGAGFPGPLMAMGPKQRGPADRSVGPLGTDIDLNRAARGAA